MQTKRNLRKKGKTLRKGGGNPTNGLKLYQNHNAYVAHKRFYKNNKNPLLSESKPKNKSHKTAVAKHRSEIFDMLGKNLRRK